MKNSFCLFLICLFFASCSTLTIPEYKKKYSPPEEFKLPVNYIKSYRTIRDKMPTCYHTGMSGGGINQLVVDHIDEDNGVASIYYVLKPGMMMPDMILYYLEINKITQEETNFKVYAKGDLSRTTDEFIKNIKAWSSGDLKTCH
jgi:hypothetical protein